jgi:GNAT superfamily N-acetyltransferase
MLLKHASPRLPHIQSEIDDHQEDCMLRIFYPESVQQLDQVRELFRGFVAWTRTRYDAHLVDMYFDPSAFEAELRGLPGEFARPEGNLLLATYDGHPAGCVGSRRLDSQTCEMKRMFVATEFQGQGIGRAISEQLIREARDAGYLQAS